MLKIGRAIAALVHDAPQPAEAAWDEINRSPRPWAWRPPSPEPTPTDVQRPARRPPTAATAPRRATASVVRAEVRAALAVPAGVRRALLMQEILGPPKALRSHDSD